MKLDHPAPCGTGRTGVPNARPESDCQNVCQQRSVRLVLSNGAVAVASAQTFELFLALGFGEKFSADSDGRGRIYPRLMVHDPRPIFDRSRCQTLARTLVSIRLVKREMEGGERAPAKGWVVRHANGNTLDCRDSNLLCLPAARHRNGFRAVWGVRERWKLMRRGLDPNKVFARRRREARAKCCGSRSESLTGARWRSASPRGRPKGFTTRVAPHRGNPSR